MLEISLLFQLYCCTLDGNYERSGNCADSFPDANVLESCLTGKGSDR